MMKLMWLFVLLAFGRCSYGELAQEKRLHIKEKEYSLGNIKKFISFDDFINIGNFSEGLAIIRTKKGLGFIDKNGDVVIPTIFSFASNFSEGLAVVNFADEKHGYGYGYINKNGKTVIPLIYSMASPFSDGIASVAYKDKWGAIDKKGTWIINPTFDDLWEFDNNLAAAKLKNRWGFINKKGEIIIPLIFELVCGFSEDMGAVKFNGKWGYIDKQGKWIIYPRFNNTPGPFIDGQAKVYNKGESFFINKEGKNYR